MLLDYLAKRGNTKSAFSLKCCISRERCKNIINLDSMKHISCYGFAAGCVAEKVFVVS